MQEQNKADTAPLFEIVVLLICLQKCIHYIKENWYV